MSENEDEDENENEDEDENMFSFFAEVSVIGRNSQYTWTLSTDTPQYGCRSVISSSSVFYERLPIPAT